ncbi:hypothetical protein CMN24_04040 [Candidatus Saccharibacteria bacterium]|nr:hypothetical protein [Candidatus Saccharibacteria bacterium]
MPDNKTVRINNRLYDAATGLPIEEKAPKTTTKKATGRPHTPAAAIHSAPQRSQTLHRRSTKKPGLPKRPQPGKHMDIARSSAVKRFAPHPVTAQPDPAPVVKDAPAKDYPIVKRAAAKSTPTKSVAATPKQIKDAAIAKALAPDSKRATKKKKESKTKQHKGWTRRKIVFLAFLLVLMGAAAVTYINLPSLSVAFASSQSGVDATYPKYIPSGYGLQQPVTFSNGEVALTFASHSSDHQYTITQSSSTWDSSAVLENVVKKEAGDNYTIDQEQGLRIYLYDQNAAWVNGGILYVITSDAPLSNEQMRRIATSL